MPFLNRYIKTEGYIYYYSLKIGTAIYNVGEGDDSASVITKLNLDGTVVWEKSYLFEEQISFRKIISCSNASDFLVLGTSVGNILYLMRINSNGTILWKKQLSGVPNYQLPYSKDIDTLVDIGNENYILAFSEGMITDSTYTVVIKFDANGTILAQKKLTFDAYNFEVKGIAKATNKIGLYGSGLIDGNSNKRALIVEMDFNLNTVQTIIESNTISEVNDLIYTSQNFIVRGTTSDNFDFFVKLTISGTTINYLSEKLFVGSKIDNLKYNANYLYTENYERENAIISKIDYSFNPIWTKQFSFINVQPAVGILCDVANEDIILNNSLKGAFNTQIQHAVVGSLDSELTSCRTTDEELVQLVTKACTFFVIQTAINLVTFDYSFVDVSAPEAFNLNSSIEPLCPDLGPCIKDEALCAEYIKLDAAFTKCVEGVKTKNPDYLKSLSLFKDCFQQFLEMFLQINSNYPQYNLEEHLQFQIEAIQAYIIYKGDKGIEVFYNDALSAVEFILNYLSQLGNCNCENVLELTDYSSIQSGHLYLQSAGSVGEDSTQGIHLRWALRDALSDHLPKANYATTTHNFNKNDDYVKIYRAKYVPFKTTLDFNIAPLQVNEFGTKRNWVYEVSGKVFHVHFSDIAKYNQVRSSLNPATDTLLFIKNYGNSVIEVETKTELSFKISPKFQILTSNHLVKTELLSVAENKITSPKAAALRKNYAADELNNTSLVSENIRSIRFSSTASHIELLSFEFYSDFILTTQKQNKWNFIGKYALTKETNVAYQRLEPEANCLENWLRYNDQAFVNVDNYHTRWNSNSIPELERIYTSVDKYIELSDALNNPTAIEIFPFDNYSDVEACNLTNPDYDPDDPNSEPEYDPYIPEPPVENSGIEIPFLEVLKLGSLDYHVARMLGLGTLDLNPIVFDGAYMYLSEYMTFGDLKDGLGARQVQHLYCSLPTSLQDQRLPLPVNLKEPVPGIFFNNGYDDSEVDENEDEFIEEEQINLVTPDGFSPDGKTKYYSLFPEYDIDELADAPFYYISNEFIACETTEPVFAGLEYRKTGEINWIKPELSYHPLYFNVDTSGVATELTNETVELVLPEEDKPLFTHAVKENCNLDYSSYGINWFSRATLSEVVHPVEIILPALNELLPPTNVTATLIQKEVPLLLTSSKEQDLFTQNELENPSNDKTLVRLTFEYNHGQELIDYHQKNNGETIPNYFETDNNKELFADKIQIFFRNQVPNSVSGKVSFVGNNSNPLLIEVETTEYVFASNNESVVPSIPNGTESNYIGSVMLVDNVEYVIHEIDNTGNYPKFILFKADASGAILNSGTGTNTENEILPTIGSLFVVVENMQNPSIWGLPTNLGFNVVIDHDFVHREEEIIIKNIDCTTETHVQKFRGIYENATIEKILEKVDEDGDGLYDTDANDNFILKHLGLYKITFPGFKLPQHSQYYLDTIPYTNSVEFYNGIVRLHTFSDISGPRKEFKVIRTENIGSISDDLVLYIEDLTFPSDLNDLNTYKGKLMDDMDDSISQMTNYYPGYKVYLYKDDNLGLNETNVLPQGDDEVRYSVFGLRSWDLPNEFQYDNTEDFFSKMSVPALMFANAVMEPVQPQRPTGGMYATRPDYFGKSTYTFNTKYGTPEKIHKPYSVQFNRASDIQFLSAIYNKDVLGYDENTGLPILNTVQDVMQNIFLNGEEDFYVDRWNDLLSFNYPSGSFATFEDRTLPFPDNPSFIESINTFIDAHNAFYNNSPTQVGHITVPIISLNETVIPEVVLPNGEIRNAELKIKDFLKDVLLNCFVPLTEVPVLYNFVKLLPYKPIPKKQVVRDRNGNLLQPTLDPESNFDMAPMMCRIDPQGQQYESQFTDFGLDGASNAKYFYAVREINNQMKTSNYSEILGPISLVNTAPPVAPEIIKVIPVLENRTLGITPSIQLQINAYPKAQNIAKVSIYRADNPSDSLSIRTMKLVRIFDLEVENLLDESKWIFDDDFSDLPEVPFGDPQFYRMTVSRRIRYNDKELINVVDYAPSEASKLIITNIVENYSPSSPILDYYSEPLNANNELTTIVLHWEKTCYKGKYHLHKMNSQGNWIKIHELQTNNQDTYLPLELTDLQSGTLSIMNSENNSVYHHFKVIAENTAGMMSSEERILTIHSEANWQDIGGIGDMIVGGTFYIR